ncbi:urease subunit alpha [Modestobacter sp. DSM 44400]|uniref:urease subunit alpha n=1 Tax=Modestobacter sp. DSM 44400 TaxID=1550230 RepID=UPI00089CCCC7|nr:urease subunit alpha [Modestobacter sp. DSM 44400]SDY84325.1 urease subunit alpha [Modestobacter sp. DSM 44400]
MATIDAHTYSSIYGPTTGDVLGLGDSGLVVRIEQDDVAYGDEILGGCGKTWRDGFYVRGSAGDSELDLLVSNVVLIDPVLGVRKTCIGIKEGRVVGMGRAGSPDVVDGVDLVVGPHTALVPGEGLVATPGAVDSHVHLASPALVDVALSAGITTMVGMGIGGVWDVGVNPRYNIHTLTEAFAEVPINIMLLARGSTTDRGAMQAALDAGAGGFKVHEDYGASPACIDACLTVAESADVAVALHSDSLNEFGLLADTIEATAGRTIHAYHVEGGGGYPDLLEILQEPHVLGSSTTPTIPYGKHTLEELFPMTMNVHRQTPLFASDIDTTHSRLHEAGIQAENHLHHRGAISIINSDALGMGRIGEMVRRTWQLASHPALGAGGGADADTRTVLQFLAKITVNPAIAHGIAQHVGSLQPGRLADIVLWDPAWFGTKPELVLKSGFVAWGAAGQGNGSTRSCEPRVMGPYFGAMGAAPRRLAATFVTENSMRGGQLVPGPTYLPVRGTRGLTRADMWHNDAVPRVHVPRDGSPVEVDGHPVQVAPLAHVPYGQGAYLA